MPILTRVVVFGTVLNGVRDLACKFQDYLEQNGIINPEVQAFRDVDGIEDAFYGRLLSPNEIKAGKPKPSDSLPVGVIALPEMRQYDYAGMTVETPFDFIEALCEKHRVPFVRFDKAPTLEELQVGATAFLPQQNQLGPGTPEL